MWIWEKFEGGGDGPGDGAEEQEGCSEIQTTKRGSGENTNEKMGNEIYCNRRTVAENC